MMKNYFQQLYRYNRWANRLILNCFESLPEISDQSMKWMSHVISAEMIWYKRLDPSGEVIPLWDIVPLPHLKDLQETIDKKLLNWIEGSDGKWEELIGYQNTQGASFQTPLHQILTHLANHGSHHRGMIVADIRNLGHPPPATDFIIYVRGLY